MSTDDHFASFDRPRRAAAQKASVSVQEQLQSSSDESDEEQPSSSQAAETPVKKKPGMKNGRGAKLKSNDPFDAKSTPPRSLRKSLSAITPRPVSKVNKNKRPLSSPETLSDDDLPPPSSLSRFSVTDVSSLRPDAVFSPAARTPESQPRRVQMSPRETSPLQFGSRPSLIEHGPITLHSGSLVFVRVNRDGKPAELQEENESVDGSFMWWPAKVVRSQTSNSPCRVALFAARAPLWKAYVELSSPCHENVQPMRTRGGSVRFNVMDFTYSVARDSTQASPRKKQKSNFASHFEQALEEMLDDEMEDNDGLPSVMSALRGSPSKKPESASAQTLDMERWSPPPCDPLLDIPGELVLAHTRGIQEYFPAKILKYFPPTKPKEKPKYCLLFLDYEEYTIPRHWFYTSSDPEFGSCKLGQWETPGTSTNEEFEEFEGREDDRALSPEPTIPPLEEFDALSIHEQFGYVKPVLSAILNDQYPPAKERHDAFLAGKGRRAALQKAAGARGLMFDKEVSELRWYLIRWALRDERFAKNTEEKLNGQAPLAANHAPLEPTTEEFPQIGEVENQLKAESEPVPVVTSHAEDPDLPEDVTTVQSDMPPLSLASDETIAVQPQSPVIPATELSDETTVEEPPPEDDKMDIEEAVERQPKAEVENAGPSRRQQGCEAYEALSSLEKLTYCADVLLPETILQILLWRSGDRKSLELLEPEEEERLRRLARIKVEERDWVDDVMRLRDAISRTNPQKPSAPKPPSQVAAGGTRSGTRSRPRWGSAQQTTSSSAVLR